MAKKQDINNRDTGYKDNFALKRHRNNKVKQSY